MVKGTTKIPRHGNILQLVGLRDIQDSCLVVRGVHNAPDYVAVLEVAPVNFSLMSEREQVAILESFRVLLQRLEEDEQITIHVSIRPYDITNYLERLREAQGQDIPTLREMAKDHEAFISALASERSILDRRFFIRIRIPQPTGKGRKLTREEAFDQAKAELARICEGIMGDLRRADLAGYRLDDRGLAQYYLDCVNARAGLEYPIQGVHVEANNQPIRSISLKEALSVEDEEEQGQALAMPSDTEQGTEETGDVVTPAKAETSDQDKRQSNRRWFYLFARQPKERSITPHTSIVEILQPSLIENARHYVCIHHERSEYLRGRVIVGYPARVVPGWLDRIIQIDEPYIDIVLYVQSKNNKQYIQHLTQNMARNQATLNINDKSGRIEDPYARQALEQEYVLRDQLVSGTEKVFSVAMYLYARGASPSELKQRDDKLHSLCRALDLETIALNYRHLQAWQALLPDAKDVISHTKTLTTSALCTAFPFSSSSLSTEPGVLVGIMPSGAMVVVNPASPQLENGNLVVLARSGAGKSFFEKTQKLRLRLMDMEFTTIDPESEYAPVCAYYGGANIHLSSEFQLNPFDLATPADKDRKVLADKQQSLLVLFDLLLAEKEPGILGQREKAFLSKCILQVYANRGIKADPDTHNNEPPCMEDLYQVIRSGECGPDSYDLGDRLLRFVPLFPRSTSVRLDNKLTVFNVRDLPDELRAVGLYLIIDYVWTRVRSEAIPRPRIFTLDEAWVLLSYPEAGRYLAGLVRRARKYNLHMHVLSQNPQDFLENEWGRVIVGNAALKFLMKQDATSIDAVAQAFHLSEEEKRYLLTCERGEGLFYINNSHVPLRVVASELEYRLATTNPQDLLEMQRREQERQEREAIKANAVAVSRQGNVYDVVMPQIYSKDGANGDIE